MSTLYELTGQFMQLWDQIDDQDIDDDVILDTLEGIDGEIEIKADGYAKVLTQIDATAAAIKEQETRLQTRRKTLENRAAYIKKNLQNAMEMTGKTKFKTDLFSFNIAKNGGKAPLVIGDEYKEDAGKLPERFRKTEIAIKADTDAIREALDAGEILEFATYGERGKSLRIR